MLLLVLASALVSSVLAKCAANEYISQGICTKCNLNCLTCSTQSYICTTCSATYYLDGSQCKPCPYKCASCDGSGKCLTCQDGSSPNGDPTIPCGDPSGTDIPIRDACFIILIVAVFSTFMYMLYTWFCYRESSSSENKPAMPTTQTNTLREEMKPLSGPASYPAGAQTHPTQMGMVAHPRP